MEKKEGENEMTTIKDILGHAIMEVKKPNEPTIAELMADHNRHNWRPLIRRGQDGRHEVVGMVRDIGRNKGIQ